MPLFRRKDDGGDAPAFEDVVDRALRALGREHDRREDHVDIKTVHGWRGYDLSALRARCEARPPDTWLGIATKELRETVELAEREPPAPEWDEARTMLKLRLHHAENVPAEYPLGIPFGDDLIAVLALDRGDTAKLLRLTEANHWARPFDDLLDVARGNTQAEPDLKRERIELTGGGGIAAVWSSNRWFAATQAMWPERMLGGVGRHGALVAAPNPHVALAHAIEDHRTFKAVEVLRPWAQRRVEAVETPISPHLYWWRPGNVVRFDDERRAELEALLGSKAAPPSQRISSTMGTVRTRSRKPDR